MYVEDFEEDFNRETGERVEPGRDEPPKGEPVERVRPEDGGDEKRSAPGGEPASE